MTAMLTIRRDQLVALCQKYRVRRLDVFGSAARDDFNEQSSDIDLLVEFDDMPSPDRGDAYLGLLNKPPFKFTGTLMNVTVEVK